jgi:DNA (cytosine-5)-methyltransferase 1
VGGFSLGIEQAGFDVLVAVESDPVHACAYKFNFPLTEVICQDITKLSADTIRQAALKAWIAHYKTDLWDGKLISFWWTSLSGFFPHGQTLDK